MAEKIKYTWMNAYKMWKGKYKAEYFELAYRRFLGYFG